MEKNYNNKNIYNFLIIFSYIFILHNCLFFVFQGVHPRIKDESSTYLPVYLSIWGYERYNN